VLLPRVCELRGENKYRTSRMSGGYSCPRHVYCGLSPGDALIRATLHVTPRSHERNSEMLAEISDHGCVEPGSSMPGTGRRTDQGQSIPGQKPAVYDYSYPWLNPLPSAFLALLCRTIFKSFFRDAGGASSLSSLQAGCRSTNGGLGNALSLLHSRR
jgi:hypothetical protein